MSAGKRIRALGHRDLFHLASAHWTRGMDAKPAEDAFLVKGVGAREDDGDVFGFQVKAAHGALLDVRCRVCIAVPIEAGRDVAVRA